MSYMSFDVRKMFLGNLCTFEVAKQAAAAGVTSANLYFAYDDEGGITDGGWMPAISEHYKFYPAINLPFAIQMLTEEVPAKEIGFYGYATEQDALTGKYTLVVKGKTYESGNIVDAFVLAYIDNKKS